MANRLNVANIGYNDATDALTIDSSGNVTAAGTLSAGTISEAVADAGVSIDGLTLKDGGIQFRTATGSGEAGVTFGSGTLDDYEEGTFSVTLTPAGGSMTMDTDRDTFQYVKIGRMVHVQGYTRPSSVSSPTGVVTFSLPFASTVGTEYSYVCYGVAIGENLVSGTSNGFSVRANSDSVTADIFYTAGGKSASDWSAVGQKFQANTNISINLVYEAA